MAGRKGSWLLLPSLLYCIADVCYTGFLLTEEDKKKKREQSRTIVKSDRPKT